MHNADMIDVDGVNRPRHNSNGSLIHSTEDGIRNFWRWFGDSQAVDKQGRPLVVYHGTQSDFTSFNKKNAHDKEGKSLNLGWGKGVFYFSRNVNEASHFAYRMRRGRGYEEGNAFVMPVYLSIDKPFDAEKYYGSWQRARDGGAVFGVFFGDIPPSRSRRSEMFVKLLKKNGCNGILYGDEITAFDSSQIKSAIGNSGDFNPNSTDLCDSRVLVSCEEVIVDDFESESLCAMS